MKPSAFSYTRPTDVAGALSALAAAGSAKLLAGGQSLGPMLNLRLVQPDVLVDISAIDELRMVDETGDGITLGACITHADIEDGRVPDVTGGAMPTVARDIAYRAVRNRGTIGGSLSHADPAADWITTLAALGATARIRGAAGERDIAVGMLLAGALQADIGEAEILVSVHVPRVSPRARWGFVKFCRKTGEFAHAMAAYVHDPDTGTSRAVIGATDGRPLVIETASRVVGDDGRLDTSHLQRLCQDHGMRDPIDRQLQIAALGRAVSKANA